MMALLTWPLREMVLLKSCLIKSLELFTHCYGRDLNLAAGESMKQCKLMKDALDTTYEKYTPKRSSTLEK